MGKKGKRLGRKKKRAGKVVGVPEMFEEGKGVDLDHIGVAGKSVRAKERRLPYEVHGSVDLTKVKDEEPITLYKSACKKYDQAKKAPTVNKPAVLKLAIDFLTIAFSKMPKLNDLHNKILTGADEECAKEIRKNINLYVLMVKLQADILYEAYKYKIPVNNRTANPFQPYCLAFSEILIDVEGRNAVPEEFSYLINCWKSFYKTYFVKKGDEVTAESVSECMVLIAGADLSEETAEVYGTMVDVIVDGDKPLAVRDAVIVSGAGNETQAFLLSEEAKTEEAKEGKEAVAAPGSS